jgi:hypothetical protein
VYQLVSSVECPICHDSPIVQLPLAPSLHNVDKNQINFFQLHWFNPWHNKQIPL